MKPVKPQDAPLRAALVNVAMVGKYGSPEQIYAAIEFAETVAKQDTLPLQAMRTANINYSPLIEDGK